MFLIPRDIGGTVRWRAPRRPDASPTVGITNASGGTEVASGTAATLSLINTTLSAAASPGDEALSVASTTGMARGDEYLVEDSTTGQFEFCRVKLVFSATRVDLQYPLRYSYASSSPFRGTYISYAVSSSAVTRSEDSWRARFAWAISAVSQQPLVMLFDVVRHWPSGNSVTNTMGVCNMNTIRDYDPMVTYKMAVGYDFESNIMRAYDDVIRDVNQSMRAASVIPDDVWEPLTALKFLAAYVGAAQGTRNEGYREYWTARYAERFGVLKGQLTSDHDEDAAVESHERGVFGGELFRA